MSKNKLEALLGARVSEEDVVITPVRKRNLISQVYITSPALEKAYRYAELVCDVLKESLECYGYLITPKDTNDRVARDVYLAANQEASSAGVEVSGQGIIESGREIDKIGFRVLGWWHSHADFDTFHSSTDNKNMLKILNVIAPTNYIVGRREILLLNGQVGVRRKGKDVEIYDVNNPDRRITFNPNGEDFDPELLSALSDVKVNMPVRVGFAYSVVVNARRGKPYCEIATKDYCGLCWEGDERSVKSRLRIVDGPKVSMNKKEMSLEIKTKVKKPRPIIPVKSFLTRFKGLFGGSRKSNVRNTYPYNTNVQNEKQDKDKDGFIG